MPSFNRGDTLTLTLDYDDVLTFTGKGNATITPVGGSSTNTYINGTNITLGPFKNLANTTVSIVCDTAGSYTITSDSSVGFNATGVNGNGQSVVAFGDSMTQRINGFATITVLTRANNVATATVTGHALGSGQIIDVNNCQDATYNVRNVAVTWLSVNTFSFPSFGADGSTTAVSGKAIIASLFENQSDFGYWHWLQGRTQGAFRLVKNAGITSNTSDLMLARVDADVLAYQSDWVFFQPTLYNDVVNAGYSSAQIIAFNQPILAKLLGAGRRVLLIGPPAITTGLTAARLEIYFEVMRWMQLQAQTLSGVYFADVFTLSVNPTAGTGGQPRTGMLAPDGFHESPLGAYTKATAIINAIGALLFTTNRLTTCNSDNYATNSANDNIWEFAPWTNTGGTINVVTGSGNTTGSVAIPAGLQADSTLSGAGGTAVWTTTTGTDGVGFAVQVVVTPSAANDFVRIRAVTPIASSRFVAGNKVRFSFRIKLTNVAGSNLKGINALLFFAGTVANSSSLVSADGAGATDCGYVDGTYTFVSSDIVIPSDGISSMDARIQLLFAAAGTALTAQIERISVRKV
jgi:lysophospholipase L1-like esterase